MFLHLIKAKNQNQPTKALQKDKGRNWRDHQNVSFWEATGYLQNVESWWRYEKRVDINNNEKWMQ